MKTRLLMTVIILILSATSCNASWLIYHKPAFKGRVVDLDTGEPVEGVAIVALYRMETLNPPEGPYGSYIHAKETITDRDGKFVISSYRTTMNPLSWSKPVEFIIFKPGYICNQPIDLEEEFSGNGTRDWIFSANWNSNLKYRVLKSGVVMLAKVKTDRDRIESYHNTTQISVFKSILPLSSKTELKENKYILELKHLILKGSDQANKLIS